MNPFAEMRSWFIWITQELVYAAMDFYDAGFPWSYIAYIFQTLSDFTAQVSGELFVAANWYDDVVEAISDILSWANIRGLIRSWLDGIEDMVYWFQSWEGWVRGAILVWWTTAQDEVLTWINDLESWTISQLNSIRDWVLVLISDVESWTLTQINNVKSALLVIISDLEGWTTTEFNIVRDWVLVLISDVESWTTVQINTVKAMIEDFLPWNEILANIITWGVLTVTQISSLIDSTIRDWFPFYESLSQLWDSVAEFITDPLQWLYNKMDEWFERFW